MISNKQYDEDGAMEAVFDSKYTEDEMEVLVSPKVSEEYVEKCVQHFENLSDELLDKICDALCRYYDDVKEDAEDVFGDLGMPETVTGREILDYCCPSSLIVDTPPSEKVIGYSVEGGCDWEPEHGFQVIIRGESLLFVSSFEGRNAWYSEESYHDEWNYAWTER